MSVRALGADWSRGGAVSIGDGVVVMSEWCRGINVASGWCRGGVEVV
jgi:hypothetical protein